MADKNITMRQKDNSGTYNKLYPKTTATQSKLSTETAALFGDNITDADAAMRAVANTIKTINDVSVIVRDPNGNLIKGATLDGVLGTPTTDENGKAHGVATGSTITIKSPYIDLQDQTVDVSQYAGSFQTLNVTLPIVGENYVKRFTTTQRVYFSKMTKSYDVCCVGGGGGGSISYYVNKYVQLQGAGGGGGGIKSEFGLTPYANVFVTITVGAGGAAGQRYGTSADGKVGGTSVVGTCSAPGGGGGQRGYDSGSSVESPVGGTPGIEGCGTGGVYSNGTSNTTISEFNDGKTFYSGGGGSGSGNSYSRWYGGTPNGAYGGYLDASTLKNAGSAGYGGGGGGGAIYARDELAEYSDPSAGGSGLVAIRFHF